jgi:hypothetical protein
MKKITKDQAKDTGMAMVLICMIVFLASEKQFLLQAAVGLLIVNMTWPKFFKPVASIWLGFSHVLGNFASKILLSVLFFTILTPIGLIRRLGGADTLKLKEWRLDSATAFTERKHKITAEDLEHPY